MPKLDVPKALGDAPVYDPKSAGTRGGRGGRGGGGRGPEADTPAVVGTVAANGRFFLQVVVRVANATSSPAASQEAVNPSEVDTNA